MSSETYIHPTAIVSDGAVVGDGTRIGAYSIIGPDVRLGEGCDIGPHVVIEGPTTLGDRNHVFQFASLGAPPQDLKFGGEDTKLSIGSDNTIRESVTINRATVEGGGVTTVGDHNLFMAYAHVAHDSNIGSHVVMANCASPAGHVTVEDYAIVGGLAAIHQFCRVGESAMLGGGAMAVLDVPPFCIATGDRAKLQGPNVVGLKRRGLTDDAIRNVRAAYRILFQSNLLLADALARLDEEYSDSPEVQKMADFIRASKRGVCR